MKVVFDDPNYVVIDDVFPEQTFDYLRRAYFSEDLKLVGHFDTKAFSVSDGIPYRAAPHYYMSAQFKTPNASTGKFAEFASVVDELHRKYFPQELYKNISVTAYCYQQGTGLGWHNDAGTGYHGSYAYYLHSEWKPTWGGHLLIGEDEVGGRFIPPRPNRLVFIRRGIPHMIQRIDRNAGENCRLSLSGFFLRDML